MIYDPVTTAIIYVVGILLVFTIAAAVADLWVAHDEREERKAARDELRAARKAAADITIEFVEPPWGEKHGIYQWPQKPTDAKTRKAAAEATSSGEA